MKTPSLIAICVALASVATTGRAAIVSYAIDPLASSLTLSGDAGGAPFGEQVSGSLVTSFGGTITGDLAGNALTFGGDSTIVAQLNLAGPFVPAGTGVDNYGVTIPALPGGGIIAFRDMVFTFVSGTAVAGSPSTATIGIPGGKADYDIAAFGGTGSLALNTVTAAANASSSNVTLVTAGSTETLTIPINVTYSGNPTSNFTGTLVATRTIPEPTSLVLALAGLAGILRRRK